MIYVHDFNCGEVLVKVGVRKFGLNWPQCCVWTDYDALLHSSSTYPGSPRILWLIRHCGTMSMWP